MKSLNSRAKGTPTLAHFCLGSTCRSKHNNGNPLMNSNRTNTGGTLVASKNMTTKITDHLMIVNRKTSPRFGRNLGIVQKTSARHKSGNNYCRKTQKITEMKLKPTDSSSVIKQVKGSKIQSNSPGHRFDSESESGTHKPFTQSFCNTSSIKNYMKRTVSKSCKEQEEKACPSSSAIPVSKLSSHKTRNLEVTDLHNTQNSIKSIAKSNISATREKNSLRKLKKNCANTPGNSDYFQQSSNKCKYFILISS